MGHNCARPFEFGEGGYLTKHRALLQEINESGVLGHFELEVLQMFN